MTVTDPKGAFWLLSISMLTRHWGKLLFLTLVAGFYLSPVGFIAVKYACSKDGGETIFDTVFTDGYYYKSPHSRCDACMYEIGAKTFSNIDYLIKFKSAHPLTTAPGFNRFSVEAIESNLCRAWRESEEFRNRGQRYKLADEECIALAPIDTPARYQYEKTLTDVRGPLLTKLRLNKHEIVDQESDRTLAVYRQYLYIPLLKRYMFEWTSPIWKCETESGWFNESEFRQLVLRNQLQIDQE